jgi:hypothetical protein
MLIGPGLHTTSWLSVLAISSFQAGSAQWVVAIVLARASIILRQWTIPLATWLYPVFLLRFVRTQPLLRGILLVLLALGLVLAFELLGFLPLSGPSTTSLQSALVSTAVSAEVCVKAATE